MTAGGVPTGEIASRITNRIGRREAITKPKPAQLLVLLGQNVLNHDVGGPMVTIAQARHLLRMAARPNIELRIIPDHCGWHPGLEGAFAVIESHRAVVSRNGAAGRLESIVLMDTRRSVLMLHEDGDVDAYKRAVDKIMPTTLGPDASSKFLADVANNRMETT